MLWRRARAGQQFLFRQLDRRHVSHILVVDDQIDRIILEGQPFGIRLRTAASPTTGFCPRELKLEEGLCDIDRTVSDALLFKGEEFLAQFQGQVAQTPAYFSDNVRFRSQPAEAPELLHEEPAVGET